MLSFFFFYYGFIQFLFTQLPSLNVFFKRLKILNYLLLTLFPQVGIEIVFGVGIWWNKIGSKSRVWSPTSADLYIKRCKISNTYTYMGWCEWIPNLVLCYLFALEMVFHLANHLKISLSFVYFHLRKTDFRHTKI